MAFLIKSMSSPPTPNLEGEIYFKIPHYWGIQGAIVICQLRIYPCIQQRHNNYNFLYYLACQVNFLYWLKKECSKFLLSGLSKE